MKRALITGVTGQDGSYLAELLIEKGYEVYGLVRRSSVEKLDRIRHIKDQLNLVQGDLTDQSSLDEAIRTVQPDEVYNLAAQSFVQTSWNQPVLTAEVSGLGVTKMLEAVRKYKPDTRFYQASSSEMFGKVRETPQNEKTPFHPRSPYGVAKAYGHHITVNYRESYDIFACSGICFNHESPRRGLEFVTRKVTHEVARIRLDQSSELRMGNLEARRDWGYAPEYVELMWKMLQQNDPDDYVLSTGRSHSVKDLLVFAFEAAGLNWEDYVVIDEAFIRPAEVDHLIGDSRKAQERLSWKPRTGFKRLIEIMVEADMQALSQSVAPSPL